MYSAVQSTSPSVALSWVCCQSKCCCCCRTRVRLSCQVSCCTCGHVLFETGCWSDSDGAVSVCTPHHTTPLCPTPHHVTHPLPLPHTLLHPIRQIPTPPHPTLRQTSHLSPPTHGVLVLVLGFIPQSGLHTGDWCGTNGAVRVGSPTPIYPAPVPPLAYWMCCCFRFVCLLMGWADGALSEWILPPHPVPPRGLP